jgi:nucleotidyltransferase AbiEii toxin of type IV toxin-antitoxin system
MIGSIVPQFAKLPPEQKRLWPALQPSVELGFVLYGGTAISLHLGHRRSVDFDFFHDRPLKKDLIRAAFPFMARATVLQDSPDTLTVLAPADRSRGANGVKLSFFGGITTGRVGDPLLTRDGALEVASLNDLMAHKLKVILLRPEAKDYEDIAAMIRAGVSMTQGLAAARAMFGKAFQPAAALKAAVYFEDGDLAALSRANRATLIAAASAVGPLPAVKLRSRSLAIPIGRRSVTGHPTSRQ